MINEFKEIIIGMNWHIFKECSFQQSLLLIFCVFAIVTIFYLIMDRNYYQDKYEKLKKR